MAIIKMSVTKNEAEGMGESAFRSKLYSSLLGETSYFKDIFTSKGYSGDYTLLIKLRYNFDWNLELIAYITQGSGYTSNTSCLISYSDQLVHYDNSFRIIGTNRQYTDISVGETSINLGSELDVDLEFPQSQEEIEAQKLELAKQQQEAFEAWLNSSGTLSNLEMQQATNPEFRYNLDWGIDSNNEFYYYLNTWFENSEGTITGEQTLNPYNIPSDTGGSTVSGEVNVNWGTPPELKLDTGDLDNKKVLFEMPQADKDWLSGGNAKMTVEQPNFSENPITMNVVAPEQPITGNLELSQDAKDSLANAQMGIKPLSIQELEAMKLLVDNGSFDKILTVDGSGLDGKTIETSISGNIIATAKVEGVPTSIELVADGLTTAFSGIKDVFGVFKDLYKTHTDKIAGIVEAKYNKDYKEDGTGYQDIWNKKNKYQTEVDAMEDEQGLDRKGREKQAHEQLHSDLTEDYTDSFGNEIKMHKGVYANSQGKLKAHEEYLKSATSNLSKKETSKIIKDLDIDSMKLSGDKKVKYGTIDKSQLTEEENEILDLINSFSFESEEGEGS